MPPDSFYGFPQVSPMRVLLSEQTPSGVSSVEFKSIPNMYIRLILEMAVRSSQAATAVYGYIELNGDATDANYQYAETYTYGGGTVGGNGGAIRMLTTGICGANAPANSFTIGKIEIPFYTSAIGKQVLYRGAHRRDASSIYNINYTSVCYWNNVAIVNAIKILLQAGNYVTNTIFRLYGESI